MMKIDVSVIIPFFNGHETIAQAVATVNAQQAIVREIVIVDDGSTVPLDLSTIVSDIPIELVRFGANAGPSAARNAGVRAAKGEFIAFLDCDDTWSHDKILKQYQLHQQSVRGVPTLVLSNALIVKKGGQSLANEAHFPGGNPLEWIFSDSGFLQTSSYFLERASYLDILFDETLRQLEDLDFLAKWHRRGHQILYIHDPLVNYHVGNGNQASRAKRPAAARTWYANACEDLSPRAGASFYLGAILPGEIKARPASSVIELARHVWKGNLRAVEAAVALRYATKCLVLDSFRKS